MHRLEPSPVHRFADTARVTNHLRQWSRAGGIAMESVGCASDKGQRAFGWHLRRDAAVAERRSQASGQIIAQGQEDRRQLLEAATPTQ